MSLDAPVLLTLLFAALSPWWVAARRGSFMRGRSLLHAGSFLLFLHLLAGVAGGGPPVRESSANVFPTALIEWSFAANAWGLLFALMITGIGLLVFLYALGYFGDSAKGHRFFASAAGLRGGDAGSGALGSRDPQQL